MPQMDKSSGKEIFNMKDGIFQEHPPDHKYYLRPQLTTLLKEIIKSERSFSSHISLHGDLKPETLKLRNELLEQILLYYKLHLPDFREIHSHRILHTILA